MRKFFVIVLSFCCLQVASASLFSSATLSVDELKAKISQLSEGNHGGGKGSLYAELGMRLYDDGRMADAAAAFEHALDNKTSGALKRRIYLYLGKSYESSGRPDKAIDAYRQAVTYDSKNWRRYRDLARLYFRVNLYQEAIESLETALKLNPTNPPLLFDLGFAWRHVGLYTIAENYLKRASALGHDKDVVNREFSFVYEGEGRFNDAAASLEKCLGNNSSIEDVARLVYLAALAKNRPLADNAMVRLRQAHANDETLAFYQNIVDLTNDRPGDILALANVDPALRPLLEQVKSPDKKP